MEQDEIIYAFARAGRLKYPRRDDMEDWELSNKGVLLLKRRTLGFCVELLAFISKIQQFREIIIF